MSPLFNIAVLFALGLGLGLAFPVPFAAAIAASLLAVLTAAASMLQKKMVGPSLAALVIAAGWIRPNEPDYRGDTSLSAPCTRVVEGTAASSPLLLKEHQRVDIDLSRWSDCLDTPVIGRLSRVKGRLFVWIARDMEDLPKRGDRIRLRARIKPILTRRNPGTPKWQPAESLYSASLFRRDAFFTVGVSDATVRRAFDEWRRIVSLSITESFPTETAPLARALLLGESAALTPSQRATFRRTGTAHLVSVSGLHLGLVALFFFWMANAVLVRTALVRRTDVGRIAALVTVPAAIGFALLTGCRTPVIRACIMAVSTLFARAVWRNAGTIEALSLAAVVILAADPSALTEPGFQLSFTAVLGFLFALERPASAEARLKEIQDATSQWIRRQKQAVAFFFNLLRSSAVACAVTTPLVLYHFGMVSLVAVLANLVAIPLTGVIIMPLLLTLLAASPLWPAAAKVLAVPAHLALKALDSFLRWLAAFPCTLESPGPLISSAVVTFSVALFLLAMQRVRRGMAAAAIGACLCAAGAIGDPPAFAPDRVTIDFLDVGQGDSALVTFPDGRHMLVDAGGTRSGRGDIGERVVVPALRALGVRRLEAAVLTHPDFDHAGGMPAVLNTLDVGALWENGQGLAEGAGGAYAKVIGTARKRKIPIRSTPGICGSHRFGNAEVSVIHPCLFDRGFDPSSSFNSNSLVLLVRYRGTTAALTGDIDQEVEARLILEGRIPRTDILKLAHHGSATSSSSRFLDMLSPGVAVASLGPFNPHGLPHGSVTRRLRERAVRLLRTDRLGAVRVSWNGSIIFISYASPRHRLLN